VNGFASSNRCERAFHFRDFKSPVATYGYLRVENLLINPERFKCLAEIRLQFVAAPNAPAVAMDNNYTIGDQVADSVRIGAPDRGQPIFPKSIYRIVR
jgi:hypothetical protein